VARAEAYLLAKFHLDPSNRLATIHQRHRQTGQGRQTDRRTDRQTDRTDNGSIAYGEPFYKRSPKKLLCLNYYRNSKKNVDRQIDSIRHTTH